MNKNQNTIVVGLGAATLVTLVSGALTKEWALSAAGGVVVGGFAGGVYRLPKISRIMDEGMGAFFR